MNRQNGPGKYPSSKKPRGKAGTVLLSIVGILIFLGAINNATHQQSTVDQSAPVTQVKSGTKAPITSSPEAITSKTEKVSERIPFTAVTEYDATQYEGTSYVRQHGIDGTREHTYEVTYINGVEKSRLDAGTSTTQEPVNQVTVQGTKKTAPTNCSNGTYVNSAGNTVCRPAESSSGAPSGASAQCRDGSYSYSQSRRGTCSHHGGVARWL